MGDRYAKELERALANWYYSGDRAPSEPVFNALSLGYAGGMKLLVPIEIPEALLKQLSGAENLQEGMKFSIDEDMPISFKHIPAGDDGSYLIPLFTSEEQMNMGEPSPAIEQPFAALLGALDKWEGCLGFVVDPYADKILIDRRIGDMITDFTPRSHVAFVKGSVLDMHVSAIVNSAHRTLLGGKEVDAILLAEDEELPEAFLCGGGLNGAVHEAAGTELFAECSGLGGCEVGSAKITAAHGIKNADHIIHAVGPVYEGEDFEEDAQKLLASCYRSALDLAAENGCGSVAFPCISAGACGYPVGKAARTAMIEVVEWFERHPDIVLNVYLCSFTENEYKNYRAMIKS